MDTRLKGHFLPHGFSFTTNQRSNPNVRYFCLIPYISDLGVANSRGSCFPESIKPLPLNISPVWVIKAARTPKTCTSIGLRPHLSLDELLKDKSSGRGAEKRVWKRKMRPLMELGHVRRLLHKAYNGVWRFSNFFFWIFACKNCQVTLCQHPGMCWSKQEDSMGKRDNSSSTAMKMPLMFDEFILICSPFVLMTHTGIKPLWDPWIFQQ